MAPRKAPPSAWSNVQPVPVFSFGLKGNTWDEHLLVRRMIALTTHISDLPSDCKSSSILQG